MATELRDKGKEILESMRQEFQSSKHYMINFRGMLREGDPAEEIVKNCRRRRSRFNNFGNREDIIDKRFIG